MNTRRVAPKRKPRKLGPTVVGLGQGLPGQDLASEVQHRGQIGALHGARLGRAHVGGLVRPGQRDLAERDVADGVSYRLEGLAEILRGLADVRDTLGVDMERVLDTLSDYTRRLWIELRGTDGPVATAKILEAATVRLPESVA